MFEILRRLPHFAVDAQNYPPMRVLLQVLQALQGILLPLQAAGATPNGSPTTVNAGKERNTAPTLVGTLLIHVTTVGLLGRSKPNWTLVSKCTGMKPRACSACRTST